MTDANKVMNPQHFGSDLADIQIQIQINLEIWIRMLITFGWGQTAQQIVSELSLYHTSIMLLYSCCLSN